MKLNFNNDNSTECRDARILRSHLAAALEDIGDDDIRKQVNTLIRQIDEALNAAGYNEENDTTDIGRSSMGVRLLNGWRALFGPSRREMDLARQRRELTERAEHAEKSAFDALAETSEVGRQRDDALERVRELEQELARLQGKDPA